MISGVVLAAGRSRRMGEAKALLSLGSESFITHTLRVFREAGCEDLVVVVGSLEDADARLISSTAEGAGARIVENPAADSEQIDSLRIGIGALPEAASAALVSPVDLPGLTSDIARAVISAFEQTRAPIVVPRFESGHGHPVLFSRSMFPELLTGDLPEGARSVIHRHLDDLHEVEVDDDGVIRDVNTPDEYRRFIRDRG